MSFTVPSAVKALPASLPAAFLPGIPAQPTAGRQAAEPVPGSRLVPAVASGVRVFVECPSWCTIDHTEDPNEPIEDIWHSSDHVDLKLPHLGDSDDLFTFARLGLDPTASNLQHRQTFVLVEDGGEGYYANPDQADEFADNLEAFAAQIREMARVARGGVQ
ncbi:DUF6907 domain-containing protein [Streptomyces sp. NPDC048604]|uniref:DUF6907 domain-containing protein n=1 Tax=Streptomyces sp. NPDC048604 TaxID=3365578 RepID=UPI003722F6B6